MKSQIAKIFWQSLFSLSLISSLGLTSLHAAPGGGSEGGGPQPLPAPPTKPPTPMPPAFIIVEGQVLNIHPCAWATAPVSEHDPDWQCASLEETSGEQVGVIIEIVFAASNDVAWASHPKLQGNEDGEFYLSKYELQGHLVVTHFVPATNGLTCESPNTLDCMVGTAPRCCRGGLPGRTYWTCLAPEQACPALP